MIKKILVPIDYSESSLNALDSAISIARENNAFLQILHVSETEVSKKRGFNHTDRSQFVLDAMAGNILQKHGVCTELIFAEGVAGQVIVRMAYEKKPDLVVMGAHGESGKREHFIGSNTYFVIKNANCPVLTIPEDRKGSAFERILYPVRADQGKMKHINIIKNICSQNGKNCRFEILAILPNKQSNDAAFISNVMREVQKQMSGDERIKVSLSYNADKKVSDEVLDKVAEVNADLVIVSPTLDMSNKHSFVGPFSQLIINKASIPLLTVFCLPVEAAVL